MDLYNLMYFFVAAFPNLLMKTLALFTTIPMKIFPVHGTQSTILAYIASAFAPNFSLNFDYFLQHRWFHSPVVKVFPLPTC